MPDPRINLKDPWLAALLAWLVPGAGHFYQGRIFKGGIFSVCILGTFMYGLALGDWQSVYYQSEKPALGRKRAYGYFAQVGAGLPALPALIQYRRHYSESNVARPGLDEPLRTTFVGQFEEVRPGGGATPIPVRGEIELSPVRGQSGPEAVGTFRGIEIHPIEGERSIELAVGGGDDDQAGSAVRLGPPIGGDPGRTLELYSVSRSADGELRGALRGEVPRRFLNRVQAPLEDDGLQRVHDRLGRRFELALVFTWIAGLLNILAIWDAFEGPAYGYGDEQPAEREKGAPEPESAQKAPPPAATPAAPPTATPTGS